MSFGHPLLLLTLLVLPLAAAVYFWLERRPAKYTMTFTNMDVLASVAEGRSYRRYVPPALALLALASLCVALARPHRSVMIPSDRATSSASRAAVESRICPPCPAEHTRDAVCTAMPT